MASPEAKPFENSSPAPEPEMNMAPEPFASKESTKISGQWEQLKESEGWAKKVKNVILHPAAALSIFYKERQLRLADSQLEYWKQEEAETLTKMAKTQSGIDRSGAIHSSLQRVQAEAGISLNQKKFREENRDAALERAKTFQETRNANLTFVQEKVRSIEEKRGRFMHERDMSRKVFIDTYAAKADVETRKMSEYDVRISEISGTIDTCEKQGEKLRLLMGELEIENSEDLLAPDDAEYVETMRQLRKQEYDVRVQLEKYFAVRKQLTTEKEDVARKKEFWLAKITPPKPKEVPPTPQEIIPEPVPPLDTLKIPEEEQDAGTVPKAENEERPKNVKDAVKGLSAEIREADEGELSFAQELLSGAQNAFAERYPHSKMFTWIKWFFDIFSDSVTPKNNSTSN